MLIASLKKNENVWPFYCAKYLVGSKVPRQVHSHNGMKKCGKSPEKALANAKPV